MNTCRNHPRRPVSLESICVCDECLAKDRLRGGVKKPRLAQHIMDNADLSRPARVVAKELGVSHTTVLNHRNKS